MALVTGEAGALADASTAAAVPTDKSRRAVSVVALATTPRDDLIATSSGEIIAPLPELSYPLEEELLFLYLVDRSLSRMFMRYLFLVAALLLGAACAGDVETPPKVQPSETPEADFQAGADAYWRGDYDAAREHLLPAAEAGHPKAQQVVGVMHRHGRGVRQNYREAVKWYCRAAVQGDGRSLSNLGFMYRKGLGVPRSDAKAVEWYRMAADTGNAGGQLNMGYRNRDGVGVPEDRASSYLWFSLAAKQDFDAASRAAEMRDEVAKSLAPDQLKAGEIHVQNWKPKPFDETMAATVKKSAACARYLR